ncbi:MAG: dienelactone hydrolase family protein [Chloracidobacterium sp.]|nr:dienelactone hydrolase family protein [Chloracidobacterium sp.]
MQEELMSLFPSAPEVTRRKFIVTSLSAGFALAVQPIQEGTTITTDATGLTAGEVKIQVKDGEIPAYRAMPANGRNFPVVLVVQEIFGVHEHIKDICRRFAKAGYLAVAAEMYARQGDVSKLTNINDIIPIVSKVPDSQVMSDLDAAVAWAKKNNGDTSKLAITGFCWGGRIVWLYSAHNPKLKAGVAWYGRLAPPAPINPLQPKYPLEMVKDLKAPVLGLYGGADQGIPVDTVEQMRKALKEANNPSEIKLYPDTPHGFNADYRSSYRKEQAQDGWKLLLAWFKKYGVA